MPSASSPVNVAFAPALRLLACTIVLAVALSACGRRGPLEPPPGTAARSGAQTDETAQRSTAGGSPTFRPARETDMGQPGFVNGEAPPVPILTQQQQPNLDSANAPSVNSAAAAGLRTRSSTARRSAPPATPFILDPLL